MPSRDRLGLGLAALGRPAYINGGRVRDVGGERTVEAMRTRAARGSRRGVRGRYPLRRRRPLVRPRRGVPRRVARGAAGGHRRAGRVEVGLPVRRGVANGCRRPRGQGAHARRVPRAVGRHPGLLGDRLDLYQVHSVTEDSPVLSDRALQHALAELRDGGVRVGLSTSGPRQAAAIRAALAVEVGGSPLFASVQSTWNLLETSAGVALAEAQRGRRRGGRQGGVRQRQARARGLGHRAGGAGSVSGWRPISASASTSSHSPRHCTNPGVPESFPVP